ncbi:MAG: G8 domain-containing protein [Candidatus Caldarchaeum sp.]
MATLTSVKSGRWSDPTVWDTGSVPADGDSVTIASGHTVVFDVDQSSFTTGLAGLTINGTLFIPSQSEDSDMPNFVCLKVNANINGSGTLQVGSETYRIQHPQKVRIMANGTLQTAILRFYGELRRTWDWLKNTASSGSTSIVLANGIPLRQGDIIYIAGESSFHTVSSYDESTKTVTLTSGLGGTRNGEVVVDGVVFPRNLVFLVSAQIEIVKYGSNNAAYGTGSGAVFEGVLFYRDPFGAPTAAGGYGGTFTNSVWNYCISYFITNNDYAGFYENGGGSNNRYTFCTMFVRSNQSSSAWGWHGSINGTPNSSLTDCAVYRPRWGLSANRVVSYLRCYAQDCGSGIGYISPGGIAIFDSCVFISGGTTGLADFIAKNCKFVNFGFASFSNVVFENCYAYYDGTSHVPIGGGFGSVYKNITIFLNNASMFFGITQVAANKYENITVKGTASTVALIVHTDDTYRFGAGYFRNCSIQVTGNVRILNTNSWSRVIRLQRAFFEDCSLVGTGAFLPAYNLYLGQIFIRNFKVGPSYSRSFSLQYSAPPSSYMRCTNIRIRGLEIGANSYPDAEESLFYHGYVKNRWDTNPADPSTFEFYHNGSYVGSYGYLPVYIDFPVRVESGIPIKVSGTISQLSNGEKVRVQIFRQDKEPLHWFSPDTPDYEVVFESVQSFSVNFVAPVSDLYFVRVQAKMNQTSQPVVIQDLQVNLVGGGSGDGATTISVSESTQVMASESTSCEIPIASLDIQSLNAFETPDYSVAIQSNDGVQVVATESQTNSVIAGILENQQISAVELQSSMFSLTDGCLLNSSEVAGINEVIHGIDAVSVNASELSDSALLMSFFDTTSVSSADVVSLANAFSLIANEQTAVVAEEFIETSESVQAQDAVLIDTNEFSSSVLSTDISDSVPVLSAESVDFASAVHLLSNEQTAVIAGESVSSNFAAQVFEQPSIEVVEQPMQAFLLAANEPANIVASDESLDASLRVNQTETESLRTVEYIQPSLSFGPTESSSIMASEFQSNVITFGLQDKLDAQLSESLSSGIGIDIRESDLLAVEESTELVHEVVIHEVCDILASESAIELHSVKVLNPVQVDVVSLKHIKVNATPSKQIKTNISRLVR